jgi:hypothetical protein
VGFYESPKEILACSYNCNAASIRLSDSAIAGFSSSAIYLYSVLILLFVFFVERRAALFCAHGFCEYRIRVGTK